MELTAPSFLVPGALHPALPSSAQPTRPTHSAKKQGSTLGLLALGAVSARVVARTRRAAYGYGGGGGYPRLSPEEQAERTEQKRRREAAQFFAYQQRLLQTGPPVLDERHWGMQERRLFGSNHVVAGINFSKYDNIEVTTEGGTGREIPIKSFQEACERYNLPEELTANLERCAYNIPTPVQKYSIPAVLEGSDVMVTAQTGSGKTAAFLVPIITAALQAGPKELKEGAVCPTCVILAPTRELCQQITQEAKRLTFRSPARVQAIYGGEDAVMQLRNIAAGIEIVVCAPGRLDDFLQRGVISMEEVKNFGCRKFLVLDEADRMLDMGFEPQIRNIIETYNMPEPGEGGRQTMMFSATFPQEMQDMALDFLDPSYFGISVGKVGHAATDVEQYFEQVSFGGKFDRLFNLLGEVSEDNGVPKKTIVFANTKNMVDDITSQLQSQGIQSAAMHGGRLITPANCGALQSSGTSQMYRNRALSDVKSGRISVLVATDVAARGLDVPGIEHIVNFDLPTDGETYVHRIGRTGRIGNKGRATSFVSNREQSLKSIVRAMKEAKFDDPEASDVPDWLEEMAMSSSGGRGRR